MKTISSTYPYVTLFLVNNVKETKTIFCVNWDSYEIEDIKIYLTKEGTGILHELIELDLVRTTLQTENEIWKSDWEVCRTIFHFLTSLILENNQSNPNYAKPVLQ